MIENRHIFLPEFHPRKQRYVPYHGLYISYFIEITNYSIPVQPDIINLLLEMNVRVIEYFLILTQIATYFIRSSGEMAGFQLCRINSFDQTRIFRKRGNKATFWIPNNGKALIFRNTLENLRKIF